MSRYRPMSREDVGGCTVMYCTVLYCTVLYCTVPDAGAGVPQPPGEGVGGGLEGAALLAVAALLHRADGLQYQALLLQQVVGRLEFFSLESMYVH